VTVSWLILALICGIGLPLLLLAMRRKWVGVLAVVAVLVCGVFYYRLRMEGGAAYTSYPSASADQDAATEEPEPPEAGDETEAPESQEATETQGATELPSPPTARTSSSDFGVQSSHTALMGWDQMTMTVHARLALAFEPPTSAPASATAESQRRRAELIRQARDGLIQTLAKHLDDVSSSADTPAEVRNALVRLSARQREYVARQLVTAAATSNHTAVDGRRNTGSIASEVTLTGSALRQALGLPVSSSRMTATFPAVGAAIGLILIVYLVLKATTRRTRPGGA
jgi:hypothetical protein